ncbi:ABC transporter substrate-binding protein [Acidisoma sp. S159]|jgi:NitT/TauT family transport system substrate-binding protein|uniref:ABC transporter substrate-binding protein n=1 Tax=Acidisoma sp. S159 TaxID=1747225 RepID=UPI00131CC2F2|nr:ABC transporter substrate-binding protein [Acidisoma sp. S159]
MKKILLAGVMALGLAAQAQAADHLTLQLKWVTQAQFAGYYVAAAEGYYKAANLDVTIKPGGPDINPSQVIAAGGADVIVDWMPDALAAREKGVPLVNIAQVFENAGLELTCRKDSGITKPADFKGKTLGVWFAGNQYPFLAWMGKLGYTTEGSNPDVTVLKQGFNVQPLLQKQAACISTMTYNEYWQLIEAGMTPEQLLVFKYQNEGVAMLEDGLYTSDAELKDPTKVDALARFVKASMQGWEYAAAHPEEAVKIVMANDTAGVLDAAHQTHMMKSVAELLGTDKAKAGYLNEADYARTVDVLMSDKTDPVITKQPVGAYSHVVWDKAYGH